MSKRFILLPLLFLSGCVGKNAKEKQLLSQREKLLPLYEAPYHIAPLSEHSSLKDYITYALLHQPKVRAAYFDWITSLEQIAVSRSLPDPQLSFELDIQKTVLAIMPGLMQALPGPGKLALQAEITTAESEARFFVFQRELLQTAYEVKRTYYELAFISEEIELTEKLIQLQQEMEELLLSQNKIYASTPAKVVEIQEEKDRLEVELKNFLAQKTALLAEWKAALGIMPAESDPPLPLVFDYTPTTFSLRDVFAEAFIRNPKLNAVRAELEKAEKMLLLAYKITVPDFTVWPQADVKPRIPLWKLEFGMTLPIWREKIHGIIASAQAEQSRKVALLSQEEIELAVLSTQKLVELEMTTRNLHLLQDSLIPKTEQRVDFTTARNTVMYSEFLEILNEKKQLLELHIEKAREKKEEQLKAAQISLLITGVLPETDTSLDGLL